VNTYGIKNSTQRQRYLGVALWIEIAVAALIGNVSPTNAQAPPPHGSDKIVENVHEAYRNARNWEDVENVRKACRQTIVVKSANARNALEERIRGALAGANFEHANELFGQMHLLNESVRKLTDDTCEPNDQDRAFWILKSK
jgi:hypothetical protein